MTSLKNSIERDKMKKTKMGKSNLYGKPKTYPYYVKFTDGRTSGTFKTKANAQEAVKRFGKGTIIKRTK